MSFLLFLMLTFIKTVVAAAYCYVIGYRFLEGNDVPDCSGPGDLNEEF